MVSNRKYGVEIEFTTSHSREVIAQAMRDAGLNCNDEGYGHRDSETAWKVVYDSSCGEEIVSPILSGDEGLEQIEKVCTVLNLLDCKVNKNCGLHVHLDARDLAPEQVIKVVAGYARYEGLFDALQPESRRLDNNGYCRSLRRMYQHRSKLGKFSLEDVRSEVFGNDRYRKLNLESLSRHGTIEFRQHAGTINAEKIINWINLLMVFTEKVIETKASLMSVNVTLNSFKRHFGISRQHEDQRIRNLANYLPSRLMELSNIDANTVIIAHA